MLYLFLLWFIIPFRRGLACSVYAVSWLVNYSYFLLFWSLLSMSIFYHYLVPIMLIIEPPCYWIISLYLHQAVFSVWICLVIRYYYLSFYSCLAVGWVFYYCILLFLCMLLYLFFLLIVPILLHVLSLDCYLLVEVLLHFIIVY